MYRKRRRRYVSADMNTFTETDSERHSTDMAFLVGARSYSRRKPKKADRGLVAFTCCRSW
jgi:hypothetical protein